MAELELFQFARSHFNEKARWALDWKGIPHLRRSLLPGPHKVFVQRLSGQSQLPVLRDRGQLVTGSARILEHLEERQPEPALLPAEPRERSRALEIQARFDAEVGPAVRRAMFAELLPNRTYFASLFSDDRGAAVRRGYRALFPAIAWLMGREMDLRPEPVEAARVRTEQALDFVARQGAETGYLVGGAFTVADLTAAALLAPAVQPAGFPRLPEPRAPEALAWLARWSAHPGAAWVHAIYQKHRGSSAEITG